MIVLLVLASHVNAHDSYANPLLKTQPPSRAAMSVLLSVVFLDNLGYAIVFPYLFFYASSLGANDFTYGLLLSAYSLMSFLLTPVIARLSDSYGRRKILLFALLLSGSSYVIFGAANVLWLLFLGRMLAGTTAATVPVAQAYVADVTTEKQRLRYLGWTSAAGGLAFIVGQAVGGVLSNAFGYAVPSFLAAGLAFANLASAYLFLQEPQCPEGDSEKRGFTLANLREVLSRRVVALLFAVYFMFFISFVFLQTVVPPWLQNLFGFGSLETSYVFAYIGVVSVLTQVLVLPRLSRRLSNTTLALYGVILLGIGLLAIGTLPSLVLLVLFGAFLAIGFGMLITTLSTLISLKTPKEAQGGSLGIAWSLAALSQTVGPTLAVSLFALGLSSRFAGLAFVVAAMLTLFTIPLLLSLRKHDT
jgi:DHA1 family tetracycline resistance protein-like MFS transporter